MQATINVAIAQVTTQFTTQIQQIQSVQDSQDAQRQQESSNHDDINDDTSKWNVFDLSFFDSLYDDKFIHNDEETMKHIEKNTYFKDVHLFIERAKNLAIVKKANLIRDNLWTCLRDIALTWWTKKLFEVEKRMTRLTSRSNDQLDEWIRSLHDRFKESFNVTLKIMTREKYTLRDAINRRESREYAQKIVRLAKNVDMNTLQSQLDTIYNDLNLALRKNDIKRSRVDNDATLSEIMKNMNDSKHDWWNYDIKTLRSQLSLFNRLVQRIEARDQYNSRESF